MSGGDWNRVHVECPFYKHDDSARVITCEGLVPDCDTKLRFKNREQRRMHMENYCCSRSYICCELFRALMQNYDEEETL